MLAVIPARGGSKGLPGKNMRFLAGKPLIAHTIIAARKAHQVDRVIVTTDDLRIAEIARSFDAEVPFMRPRELASDTSPAIETYLHACATLEKQGSAPIDQLVVLLPTAPLRTAWEIDQAIELFRDRNAESVISVSPSPHPLQWARVIDGEGILRDWLPPGFDGNRNRQELTSTVMPNGAIYVFDRTLLERRCGYYTERSYAYMMPKERSIDIDDLYDFTIAEFLMNTWIPSIPAIPSIPSASEAIPAQTGTNP